MEVWDEDAQYYREVCRKKGVLPTEDGEQAFMERVSMKVMCAGIYEEDAREQTAMEQLGYGG